MREIVREIFESHGFLRKNEEREKDKEPIDGLYEIFVSEYDEMYFVMTGKLHADTLNTIIDICAEEEENPFYKRSWKSNWLFIYIAEISDELTKEQRRIVMQIEENKFFCRKYVFWYSNQEKEALGKLCGNAFSKAVMQDKITDFKVFEEFKKKGNKGYECLSRLYIKLPFLNLQQVPTTGETIFTCVTDELSLVHEKLGEVFQDEEMDEILNQVELSEKERKEIDDEIKRLKNVSIEGE